MPCSVLGAPHLVSGRPRNAEIVVPQVHNQHMAGETIEEELVTVPLGALTAMFIALRMTDEADPEARRRVADLAIAQLPFACRQRVTVLAAEQLRRRLGTRTSGP